MTVALVLLAAVMVWRAELGRRARATDRRRVIEHVGFTTVGLIDAFVVVTIFNRGVPGWLTAAIAVGIAVAGHLAIHAVSSRSSATATDRVERQHAAPSIGASSRG